MFLKIKRLALIYPLKQSVSFPNPLYLSALNPFHSQIRCTYLPQSVSFLNPLLNPFAETILVVIVWFVLKNNVVLESNFGLKSTSAFICLIEILNISIEV
ncbi:MAG: hypothetical protein KAI83_05745 [Thiomargarita sp.]|nr:hypothetical protein [Thiomargarita sp.]